MINPANLKFQIAPSVEHMEYLALNYGIYRPITKYVKCIFIGRVGYHFDNDHEGQGTQKQFRGPVFGPFLGPTWPK